MLRSGEIVETVLALRIVVYSPIDANVPLEQVHEDGPNKCPQQP